MKPLLALSLLLNLCLLTALGYLLARGPEVVTETREVVVTKTLNPNIDLETRVIALAAELAQEREKREAEVESYKQKLAEADTALVQVREGLTPEMAILAKARETGKIIGDIQRRTFSLYADFSKMPDPESEQYAEYKRRTEAISALMTEDRIRELYYYEGLPFECEERQHFMAASLGASLGVDGNTQAGINDIFEFAYNDLRRVRYSDTSADVEMETKAKANVYDFTCRVAERKMSETLSFSQQQMLSKMYGRTQDYLFHTFFAYID